MFIEQCRYLDGSDTRNWEVAVTAIDIITDLLGKYITDDVISKLSKR